MSLKSKKIKKSQTKTNVDPHTAGQEEDSRRRARIGRPFKGDVEQQYGNEGDVPEKRSIFRALKKFYKGKFKTFKKGQFDKQLQEDFESKLLLPEEHSSILQMISDFKKCKSRDYTKQSKKAMDEEYIALIGDPCYRYSRSKKERFFKDKTCSYLFMGALPYL